MDAVRICLVQRPDSLIYSNNSEKWDADLIVSGHLHGGQVILPFLGKSTGRIRVFSGICARSVQPWQQNDADQFESWKRKEEVSSFQ